MLNGEKGQPPMRGFIPGAIGDRKTGNQFGVEPTRQSVKPTLPPCMNGEAGLDFRLSRFPEFNFLYAQRITQKRSFVQFQRMKIVHR